MAGQTLSYTYLVITFAVALSVSARACAHMQPTAFLLPRDSAHP
jgi:hypothetical protein